MIFLRAIAHTTLSFLQGQKSYVICLKEKNILIRLCRNYTPTIYHSFYVSAHEDDVQVGYSRQIKSISTIEYTIFIKIPPFVSAQINKCGARGKVTQK